MTGLTILFLVAGCGPVEPCEGGDMLDGPAGLELAEEEHAIGWGQADCWQCHVESSLHRVGCTAGVDLDAVQDEVRALGLESCGSCHGDNGVGE